MTRKTKLCTLRCLPAALSTVKATLTFTPEAVAVTEIETAKLANALLSIASRDSRDVEVLKRAALQRLALDYRDANGP